MLYILEKLLTSTLFILGYFAWFTFVIGLDAALTKTNEAISLHSFIADLIPFILLVGWLFSLNDLIYHPVHNALKYNKTWFKGDFLPSNHELRRVFRTCHFRAGWFGIMKISSIMGNYHIAVNAGGIWDGRKYLINPIFITYLTQIRGYKLSGDGSFLTKPIK